ncbi:MAG TPA: hypothetical protein VGG03_25570 [Thermoanaerobaculia bacterium]|jgi:hypothetical protein
MRSFVREESEVFASEAPTPALGSPFVSVYELEGHTEFFDPEQEAYSTLVQELYDEEFDEALFELMIEARGLHEEHMVSSAQSLEGERLLNQHFNQLIREAEGTVTAFEREFGARDISSLGEGELEAFAERYSPATTLSPEFEDFLGKWKKKLVGLAKKAGKFALTMGLGPVLNKIKALVKPLLNKVLQMAIGKLPESVRPAAQQLAERIFKHRRQDTGKSATADAPAAADTSAADPSSGGSTAVEDPGSAVQAPAGSNITEIQQEFDQQLASLFLASDEVDLELEVARVRSEERRPTVPVYSDLDQARERFINELQQLKEGEDPAPHIQNFLPAVLPALRLGVRLAGRGRVVGFLANLLAKMIGKLVDPATTPALSRAIVDAGLKLLSLEVSSQDEAQAAASSVAATVEETVRRVSALPDYVLDNQELLEGFALEAFEQAAAANLPPVLSEAVYRERPDLLESQSVKTGWVMLPLRRRKRYKKCGRTFKVRVSPYMADEIESFEGPLADYLQDQLGIEEGEEVEAEVYLYETLPGTTLPDIAREESETPGMGTAGAPSAVQLHPLTPKAAGLLLGEPRMGRNVPWGTDRRRVGVGQRLYHLSIPGRRLLTAPGRDGRPHPRRLGGLRVTLDGPKNEIRLCTFLSEVKAQRLAVRLRRQSHPGAVAAGFQKYVGRRLAPILRGERPARIRVVQAGLTPGEALGAALKRLPPEVSGALTAKLQEYLVSAFAEFAKGQSQRFTTAAEDTADGITLKFTIAQPAGLDQVCKALLPAGKTAGVADAIRGGSKPDIRVEVNAGYKCD